MIELVLLVYNFFIRNW